MPPLMVSALALLVLLALLPSALNMPQANPGQTLEYAPVPPEDDHDVIPPSGNLSSLGLGSSRSVGGAPGDGDGPGPEDGGAIPGGRGKSPSTKRCVGSPPRQTSDPLSPPCVAHYEGDNGGATYRGVSRDEIVIVIYASGGGQSFGTSKGAENRPAPGIVDFDQPPPSEEHPEQRAARALARFFNDRFQTYNRHAHVYMYWTVFNPNAERQRADAVDMYNKLKPFAVVPVDLDHTALVQPLARRGIIVMASANGKPAGYYQNHPGLLWGYLPSIEKQAEVFAAWVCKKVVGRPVSFSGNSDQVGKPRVLGLMYTTDARYPGFTLFAQEVERRVEACGGTFAEKRATPYAGYSVHFDQSDDYPVQNMSAFAAAGVTTIIWAQGYETRQSQAAASLNYRPEWFTAGDSQLDGHQTSGYQDQSVWRYAWTVSTVVMETVMDETPCYQAIREGDPDMNPMDVGWVCAFYTYYADYRQLFTGIQVAGPKLSAASMDRGFHAIPKVESTSPQVPACYYDPGDYTCIKDAVAMWWDPDTTPPNGEKPGCYRAVLGGKRFIGPTPPAGDPTEQKNPAADPCGTYIGGASFGA